MRGRLIELIKQAGEQECLNAVCGDIDSLIDSPRGAEFIADYILADGWIRPPCKVGDVVYQTDGVRIYESTINKIIYCTESIAFDDMAIGKSIFLTPAAVEQAMKGGVDVKAWYEEDLKGVKDDV